MLLTYTDGSCIKLELEMFKKICAKIKSYLVLAITQKIQNITIMQIT